MGRKLLTVYLTFALSVLAVPAGLAWGDQGSTPTVSKTVSANIAAPLDDQEVAHYTQLQTQANADGQLNTPGGAEAGTGTTILATLGALTLIGIAVALAAAP
ncbi:MAG: hypothetical protein BIFFINMI_01153 [Phycisphaerae bacterium]|nr:hypothetical protein [Phycisphaerae bacterium]